MAKLSNVQAKGQNREVYFLKVILDYLHALVSHTVPHKHSLCPTSGELESGHPNVYIDIFLMLA